jgi:DNA-binding NarL/FixJ family response regulator
MSHTLRQIRVIAIDHNSILLEGIAVLIRNQPDMQLKGTASEASEAVRLYLETSPDIIVIDLELRGATSFAAIRTILAAKPKAKIIGLTTYEGDNSGLEALAVGVIAVMSKDRLGEELVPLIRRTVKL